MKQKKLLIRGMAAVLSAAMVITMSNGFGRLTVYAAEKEPNLICEQTEHTHGEECYEEGTMICGLPESEEHTHGEECYEKKLNCMLTEHTHTEECYEHIETKSEEKLLENEIKGVLMTSSTGLPGARSYTNDVGDVFLGGNYIEVGAGKTGYFGTKNPPDESWGFHPTLNGVGLLSDGDGWNVGSEPTTCDFFLPGSPEERWSFAYTIKGEKKFFYAKGVRGGGELGGSWSSEPLTTDISDTASDKLSSKTEGVTADNVKLTIVNSFGVDDLFYLTNVYVENNSGKEITDVRFSRSFDPDQNATNLGNNKTYNKVICQPDRSKDGSETNLSMVVGRGGENYAGLFFMAFDNRAYSSILSSLWPSDDNIYDAAELWNQTALDTYPTDENVAISEKNSNGFVLNDVGIAISFQLGDVADNAKDECAYYTSLDPDVANSVKAVLKAANASASVTSTKVIVDSVDDNTLYSLWTKDGVCVKDWVGADSAVEGKIVFDGLAPDTDYIVKTVLKENFNDGNPESDSVTDTSVQTGIDPLAPAPGGDEEKKTEYKAKKDTVVVTNPNVDYYYRLTDKDGKVAYDKNGQPLDWVKGNTATDNVLIFKNLDACTSYYIQIKSDTNPNSDPVKVTTAIIASGNSGVGVEIKEVDELCETVKQPEDEGHEVNVNLEVNDVDESTVDSSDKEKMEQVAENDKLDIIGYIDLILTKTVDESEAVSIPQINKEMEINVSIPNPDPGKAYDIIRIKDGVAEVLGGIYNPEIGEITIHNDTFDTIAIVAAKVPTGTIKISGNSTSSFISGNTFSDFYTDAQTVEITSDYEDVDKIYYYIANDIKTWVEISELPDTAWKSYAAPFVISEEGKYVVYSILTDHSSEKAYLCSNGFVIDKTVPKMIGVTDNAKICGKDVSVAIEEKNLQSVTVNGSDVTLDNGVYKLTKPTSGSQEYTIVATDKSNNTSSVTITIYADHSYNEWTEDKRADVSEEGLQHRTCSNCNITEYQEIPALVGGDTTTTKTVEVIGDAPKTTIVSSTTELIDAIVEAEGSSLPDFVENSISDSNSIDYNNDIRMPIKKVSEAEVLTADVLEIMTKATEIAANAKVELLDIKLFVDTTPITAESPTITTQITQLKNKIKIAIEIPDNIKNKRNYKIIRFHDGVATPLDTIVQNDKLIFETDKFSTYAIAYTEPTYGGGSASIPVEEVNVSIDTATLNKVGETIAITTTITPSYATNKKLIYTSSDEKIATVDANGIVTAVGNGTVTITIATEDGMKKDTVTIVVQILEEKQEEDKPVIKDESKLTGNDLIARNDLSLLLTKGTAQASSIKLTWIAETDATKYEVYWSYCDGKRNFKKLTTTAKQTVTHKKLNTKKEYKYFVVAYKMVDGKKVYLSKSPCIHVAMKDSKLTNAKSISIKSTSVVVKKGKTVILKPSITLNNGKKKALLHATELRYYSTNKQIATVGGKSGIIKGKKTGTCYIYIIANNGVYKKVKITVK